MSIKSKTHKGKGFNELRFEDEKDQEEVFIHAQKDQNNIVKNNETTNIGFDRTEQVGNDDSLHVTRNRVAKIDKDEIVEIGNQRKLDVFADNHITTGGNHSHQVSGKSELKATEKIEQQTALHQVSGSEKVVIKGPGGAIIINSSGITIVGKVTIKGNVAISGGGSAKTAQFNQAFNEGEAIFVPSDKPLESFNPVSFPFYPTDAEKSAKQAKRDKLAREASHDVNTTSYNPTGDERRETAGKIINVAMEVTPVGRGVKGAKAIKNMVTGKDKTPDSKGDSGIIGGNNLKRNSRYRDDLDEKWFKNNGELNWPKNEGFVGKPYRKTLKKGDVIDRFSSKTGTKDRGSFLSPNNTSYSERALPYDATKMKHAKYEVVKDFDVTSGKVAPWFGEKGGGIQHKTDLSVRDLINQGFLKEVK